MGECCNWSRIDLPARLSSLPVAQVWLGHFVRACGFAEDRDFTIQLALEEVFTTILHYAYEESEARATISLDLEIKAATLQVAIISQGLPFEWSMIPDYDPHALSLEGENAFGLSAFLLKHSVDRYRLINQGKQGVRFELSWWLPSGHIANMPAEPLSSMVDRIQCSPLDGIRQLQADETIQLARLVYRSYGYSYVYEDMYYPERIVERHRAGLLYSLVAVAQNRELIGHIALMKQALNDPAVEWGIAVVDPRWRGAGVMQALLQALLDTVAQRQESIIYAHAVTSHTFTQKTCSKFGFRPTALQLCLVPCLSYKHIKDSHQRETTFISVRCLRPLPEVRVYIPEWHRTPLTSVYSSLGVELEEMVDLSLREDTLAQRLTSQQQALSSANFNQERTELRSEILSHANLATLELLQIGPDHAQALAYELKRLCREKVEVVQLFIPLTDPAAPAVVAAAEQLGFFMSGLMPMQPNPHSLGLQYLNNLTLDYADIQVDGESAQVLKDWVMAEHQLSEQLQLAMLAR